MKHYYNLNVFNREDDLSYYLLGVFCSDGNVKINKGNKGIASIASNDKEWLQQITSLVCDTTIVRPLKLSDCFTIEFYSIELVQWLIAHACVPNKSLTLKFPDIPINYLPDFIRGCWDGDGTLGLYKLYRKDRNCWETVRSCKLYTSSKEFAEGMLKNLNKLDIHATIIPRIQGDRKIGERIIISNKPNYMVAIQDKQSILNFCNKIYYPNNPINLNRKNDITKKLFKDIMSSNTIITDNLIKQIRSEYPLLSLRKLSTKYKISVRTVHKIIRKTGKFSIELT